ncbi:threonine synthase [bacterium]|nr:threonine synthase [bacterium]
MDSLLFYSTNLKARAVNAKDAILNGLAEDKGLYMPESIPRFAPREFDALRGKPYAEVAFVVMRKYLAGLISDDELLRLCRETYTFDAPIEKLDDQLFLLRLDRGPTAAFKDFAAQAMGRLINHFLEQDDRRLLILTATSGDTGSAVANAFHGRDRVKLVVLFPIDEVTERQRKLMTTLGGNVTAVAVDGKFDDCQALVKDAFVDPDLRNLELSSANSINFARLMPQIVYYVYARLQFDSDVNFCVPSGNFGNLMGGLLGRHMGMPMHRFIVAVNENDEFVSFCTREQYEPIVPSRNCISNAMNVGHPSNLARLIALYGGMIDEKGIIRKMPDMSAIRRDMWTTSVTDVDTKAAIARVYKRYGAIVEPHGAVGVRAWEEYVKATGDTTPTICLETADPAKFPETIREVIGIDPPLPDSLSAVLHKPEKMERLPNDYPAFKTFLTTRFGRL